MIGPIGGRDASLEPVGVPWQAVLCQLVAHGGAMAGCLVVFTFLEIGLVTLGMQTHLGVEST